MLERRRGHAPGHDQNIHVQIGHMSPEVVYCFLGESSGEVALVSRLMAGSGQLFPEVHTSQS